MNQRNQCPLLKLAFHAIDNSSINKGETTRGAQCVPGHQNDVVLIRTDIECREQLHRKEESCNISAASHMGC